MEPEELAESAAITLGFSLPYLLGEKTEDEAVKALSTVGWRKAKAVWARLLHNIETRPFILAAARDVVSAPGTGTMAALQQELEDTFRSNTMLMNDICDLTCERTHLSPVVMTSSPSISVGELKAELMAEYPVYVVRLLLIAGLLWMMGLTEIVRTSSTILLVFSIVAFIIKGGFLAFSARKFGLKKPVVLGLAALAPGSFLIAGLALIAYCPPHLTQAALTTGEAVATHGELRPWSKWLMVVTIFPLALFVVLAFVNIGYYLYFFENTFGILLFAATLFAYGLAVVILWIGFWMQKAYTSPRLALVSVISSLGLIFVIWSVMLGPAAAKVVTLFSE